MHVANFLHRQYVMKQRLGELEIVKNIMGDISLAI